MSKAATSTATTDPHTPEAGYSNTELVIGGLGLLVGVLVAFRVGRWLGFRQFHRAYAAALQGFADETVRRERLWQERLEASSRSAADEASVLADQLRDATESERLYRMLAQQYQGWLEGRRWWIFPPPPEDVRLAEVLRERDHLIEASTRLGRATRRVVERVEQLPADVREELRRCMDDPSVSAITEGRRPAA